MRNAAGWDVKSKNRALVGDKLVNMLASRDEGGGNTCVLFAYEEDAEQKIYALRWSLGAVVDLGTSDLEVAMGSINTMIIMESADDED